MFSTFSASSCFNSSLIVLIYPHKSGSLSNLSRSALPVFNFTPQPEIQQLTYIDNQRNSPVSENGCTGDSRYIGIFILQGFDNHILLTNQRINHQSHFLLAASDDNHVLLIFLLIARHAEQTAQPQQ